jgi:DNA-binding PadR family transcriptional regulator
MSLRYGILGLLNYEPMSGYKLKKLFDNSVNHIWNANLSQIYRELNLLEEKGYLISSVELQEERPDKKIYTITEEGKQAFINWLSEKPKSYLSPKRDEFMLRVVFASNMKKEEIIDLFRMFIKDVKEYKISLENKSLNDNKLFKSSHAHTQNNNKNVLTKRDKLFWRLTLKRARMTFQKIIQWAEECIKDIEDEL